MDDVKENGWFWVEGREDEIQYGTLSGNSREGYRLEVNGLSEFPEPNISRFTVFGQTSAGMVTLTEAIQIECSESCFSKLCTYRTIIHTNRIIREHISHIDDILITHIKSSIHNLGPWIRRYTSRVAEKNPGERLMGLPLLIDRRPSEYPHLIESKSDQSTIIMDNGLSINRSSNLASRRISINDKTFVSVEFNEPVQIEDAIRYIRRLATTIAFLIDVPTEVSGIEFSCSGSLRNVAILEARGFHYNDEIEFTHNPLVDFNALGGVDGIVKFNNHWEEHFDLANRLYNCKFTNMSYLELKLFGAISTLEGLWRTKYNRNRPSKGGLTVMLDISKKINREFTDVVYDIESWAARLINVRNYTLTHLKVEGTPDAPKGFPEQPSPREMHYLLQSAYYFGIMWMIREAGIECPFNHTPNLVNVRSYFMETPYGHPKED